jgi:predicted nucleic acid-binding Zn ribbon protein
MTPLALHVQTQGDKNIAVEMAAILDHVERMFPAIDTEIMTTKPETLCPRTSWDGKPILNRDGIIAKTMGMIQEADKHPLYVYGNSRSGRTFVKDIVKSFRPSRLHEHIEVSTLEKNKTVIREINRRVFNSEERVRHYEDSESFHAYFKREIGKVLDDVDQVCAHQHEVAFIFFDGFDVSDELTVDLFSHICGLAPQFTHIRIALSGSIEIPVGVNAQRLDLGAIKPEDFFKLAEHFCCYHELDVDTLIFESAVDTVLSTIDFTTTTLVTHANRAHDLCNSLRELSGV